MSKINRQMDGKLKAWLPVIFWLVLGMGFSSFPKNTSAGQIQNTQSLPAQKIEQLGIDYMVEHYRVPDGDTKIVVDYIGRDVVLPEGSLEYDIQMTQSDPNSNRIPLLMSINVDGIFRRGVKLGPRK